MLEYSSPGVYVQEVDSGPRPIEGVGTATAAFVGFAPEGPLGTAQKITSWTQFVETFGKLESSGRRDPYAEGSYMAHAVYGYFLNGGGRCYVIRVARQTGDGSNGASKGADRSRPALPLQSAKGTASLTVAHKDGPDESVLVEVSPPVGEAPEGAFTLRFRQGTKSEAFENVTLAGGKRQQATDVAERVNKESKLVTIVEEQATGSLAERIPATGQFVLEARALPPAQKSATSVQPRDFIGDVAARTGVEGLEIAEDVTMVCCPDLMSLYQSGVFDREAVKAVQLGIIAHCEAMTDRVAILDSLPDLSAQQAHAWRQESNFNSKYATLYYPWIKVAGADGATVDVPPSGHVAGIYARNDAERGVHKAPANEVVRGALGAATPITQREQAFLNPDGINCIRSFSGLGLRVWGARTLSGDSDKAWQYVNVRRLFNYVEKSIERGTQWVVFEPNNPDLWSRVKRDVDAFLTGLWREGMLFGRTPQEAFFVKCDEELNPPSARDKGQLFIDVGLAPVKPAEFVVFRLSQWSGGGA